jgi:hypothetical protein
MTRIDPCAEPPGPVWPSHPSPVGPDQIPTQAIPTQSISTPGVRTQLGPAGAGPHRTALWGAISPGEAPAGLGPWVPPLPAGQPQLSARAVTWFGIIAVTLIIAVAAAVAVVIGAATAPQLSRSDGLYLGSVRENSGLSRLEIGDDELVATGRAVCIALDRHPSTSGVFGTMTQLGVRHGWNDSDVAAVVGSAIGAYCPRHIALVGG